MTTVLYVGGTGRSGSSVVANVLGEVAGHVSVGELRFLWQRGLVENRLCGCAERFADCPFWSRVLQRAFGDDVPDPARTAEALRAGTRLRTLPGWLSGRGSAPTGLPDALARLYQAVAEESGARVVVDSSKLPTYAALLDTLGGIDVRVLHLVRDPRAAAFSWRRRRVQPDRTSPGLMERRGVVRSALLWTVWNAALEQLWRRRGQYVRLRYEDVVADPGPVLTGALGALGANGDLSRALVGPRTARLRPNHTVAGNPVRLTHGDVELRVDDEWRTAMPTRDDRVVTLMSAPRRARYGYPARTTAPATGTP